MLILLWTLYMCHLFPLLVKSVVDKIYKNIRLIVFFEAKDGDTLYSQQKQDWELTVAQIMNSLLPNSDLNRRK